MMRDIKPTHFWIYGRHKRPAWAIAVRDGEVLAANLGGVIMWEEVSSNSMMLLDRDEWVSWTPIHEILYGEIPE